MFDIKKIEKVDSLPNEVIEKCKNFTDKTMKVYKGEYTNRGQTNPGKIREDFLVGQLGVACVISLCEKLGFGVTNMKGEKSINCNIGGIWGKNELKIDSIIYRIKTQSILQSQMYGTSWVFNAIPRDPILDQMEASVIFVLLDNLYGRYRAYIYPSHQIKELKFTMPDREAITRNKVVVLEDNLRCFEGIRTKQMAIEDCI